MRKKEREREREFVRGGEEWMDKETEYKKCGKWVVINWKTQENRFLYVYESTKISEGMDETCLFSERKGVQVESSVEEGIVQKSISIHRSVIGKITNKLLGSMVFKGECILWGAAELV